MALLEDKRGNNRWRLCLAIAAVVLGALAAAGFARPSIGFASSTPRCLTSNLRLDKVGENDFTSHRGWVFALRNVGPVTCRVKGYPAARLVDGNARPMRTVIGHFGGSPRTVVLPPWHRAFFAITFAVSGPCSQAVFAYGVRIQPPGSASGLVWYAGRFDLCGPAPARLDVSPLAFPRQF
jgi:hypothetical protein